MNVLFACNLFAQIPHHINADRRYDEITWLINHNANNNRSDGPGGICFGGGNQDQSIYEQLRNGVKNLMVDIYLVNGKIRLKHGSPNQCMMTGQKFNNVIYDWLASHPLDIITLHVESGPNMTKRHMDDLFIGRRSGYKHLRRFIYNHHSFVSKHRPRGSGADVYPTIREMRNSGKRLVIFTERNYGHDDLYRYEFGSTVQNNYSASQVHHLWEDNKFVKHRGVDHKTILTVNHFAVDRPFGTGDKNKSRHANSQLKDKATRAWFMFGHRPSLAVDYYHLSNGRRSLDQIYELNGYHEVRGRFIDPSNPSKHIRDVKIYFAEWKNNRWQHRGWMKTGNRDAAWHLFYSLPARLGDRRAVWFSHPDYKFSPDHITMSKYAGNNSRTFVQNIRVTRKNNRRTTQTVAAQATPEFDAVSFAPNPVKNNRLIMRYSLMQKGKVALAIYDQLGNLVTKLPTHEQVEGNHEKTWKLPVSLKGLYLIRGTVGDQPFFKKVIFE